MKLSARIIHLRIIFCVDPVVRTHLLALLEHYQDACHLVRDIATDSNCSTPGGLHALAYRKLTPRDGPGLPSQYSVRAISRVAHELRLERHHRRNPYPNDCLDLDSKNCSLNPITGHLTITPLMARNVRGAPARDHRIRLGELSAEELTIWSHNLFLGAFLIIPPNGSICLQARFTPKRTLRLRKLPH